MGHFTTFTGAASRLDSIRIGSGRRQRAEKIKKSSFVLSSRYMAKRFPWQLRRNFPINFRNVLKKWGSLVIAQSRVMSHSLSWTDPSLDLGRSIWSGLRFTLSDSIRLQMGVVPNEDVEDDQVQAMPQGLFCLLCLKRLVGRDRLQVAAVPVQCRNCGLSWSMHESVHLGMPLGDLKRIVL